MMWGLSGVVVVTALFSTPSWDAMVKGLILTVRPTEDTRAALTLAELELMVGFCKTEQALLALRVGLTLGFFGLILEAFKFDSAFGELL